MPTNTYVALDKVTVGTATPSITFSSIPSTYTDLIVVASVTVATAGGNMVLTVNGDTTSGLYSKTQIEGTGSSAISGRTSGANSIGLDSNMGEDTTNPSIHILQLMNYANTSVFKTVLHRQAASWTANPGTAARVGLWRNTNAITSITLSNGGTNISVGSTFSLYGIAASSVGAKATGGTIFSDSQYYYHTFNASGTFTPTQSISADCLVVAGGGGGAHGGGGAGGLLAFTGQSLTATGYTVTVGAGGAGSASVKGTTGADSQFGALTLVKGGGGAGIGAIGLQAGLTGGSGGGGAPLGAGTGAGGSATSGQGNAGGTSGTGAGTYPGGGGGGAGAAGGTGVNATGGGAGGVGSSTYSSWGVATGIGQNVSGTYYLAGGGGAGSDSGAGAGGLGGGGAGASGTSTAGTANTGGGGGGSSNAGAGSANGGSGVVIVRYAK
jgi:hypothetical protein